MKPIGHLAQSCLALCVGFSATAATINVPADQPTIAAALSAAASGDTIAIAAGTYAEGQLETLVGSITISGATDATSGGPAVTITSSVDGQPILTVGSSSTDPGTVTIENIAFTGVANGGTGSTSSVLSIGLPGGGSASVTNCTVHDNTAAAMISISAGNPFDPPPAGASSTAVVTDCSFSGNTGVAGLFGQSMHAIFIDAASVMTSTATVARCDFSDQVCTFDDDSGGFDISGGYVGCAVMAYVDELTVADCTLREMTYEDQMIASSVAGSFQTGQPLGSCCYDGLCFHTTQARCSEISGTWSDESCTADTACPTACAADTNTDGTIDIQDLLNMLDAWGVCQ